VKQLYECMRNGRERDHYVCLPYITQKSLTMTFSDFAVYIIIFYAILIFAGFVFIAWLMHASVVVGLLWCAAKRTWTSRKLAPINSSCGWLSHTSPLDAVDFIPAIYNKKLVLSFISHFELREFFFPLPL